MSLSQFGTVTNGCKNLSYIPGKSLCSTHKESHNSENNADVNKEKAGEETYKSLLRITGTKGAVRLSHKPHTQYLTALSETTAIFNVF